MAVAKEMKAALKRYLDSVEQVEAEISELEELARVHSTVLETNQQIHVEIEAAQQEIAYLYGEREELYQDFFNATFEKNTERIEEVEAERSRIDARVEELHEVITEARGKLLDLDPAAVSEMLARLDRVNLPIFYNGVMPYQQGVAPTGVVNQLEAEHNKLVTDVGSRKRRILEMQPWSLYATREPVPA